MTIAQVHERLLAEARRHRDEDRWQVGHEWQRRADEFARLVHMAEALPRPRRKAASKGGDGHG